MQTIVVAGQTGIGKSTLLSMLARQHGMTLIDPLGENKTWRGPDPATCRGVVFDHISHLDDARAVVSAATAWCERHAVNLWLCDIWRIDWERQGIVAPDDAIELHIAPDVWPWPVSVTPGKRIACPVDQAMSIAHRLAA